MDLQLPADPLAAWRVALEQLAQARVDSLLLVGFGPRCGLLAAAQAAQQQGRQSELLELVRPTTWCDRLERYLGPAPTMRARRLVLRAAFERLAPNQVIDQLREAIRAYRTAWGLPETVRWQAELPVHGSDEAALPDRPLALAFGGVGPSLDERRFAMSASGQGLRACGDSHGELFAPLVRDFGSLDPALHLVADTWIEIFRPPHLAPVAPPEPATTRTWLLLVEEHDPLAPGVIYRLSLQRRELGNNICSGVLSPCPWSAAHTQTSDSFQASWKNAWWATLGRRPARPAYDVHWSIRPHLDPAILPELPGVPLEPLLEQRREFATSPLGGRSAEAAKICGLLALDRQHRLDECVAVTARLKSPLTDDLTLDAVGRVADKSRAELAWRQSGAHAAAGGRIREIVTHLSEPLLHDADAQVDPQSQTRSRSFDQGQFRLTGVADVDACYALLRRHSQITQELKRRLSQRADALLQAIGKPYVRTRLFRWVEVRDVESPQVKRQKEWLPAAALPRFYAVESTPGEPAVRLRLLAESGFGKSTLMIDLEGVIARGDDGRVPLRLGAGLTTPPGNGAGTAGHAAGSELLPLDDRLFQGHGGATLSEIADTIVAPLLKDTSFRPEEIEAWLKEAVQRGEVVWLLDAADQATTPDLSHLGQFLHTTAARCAAVVTGRPEITQTCPGLWRLQRSQWQEWAAGGFGGREIVQYCTLDLPADQQRAGRELARQLLRRKSWRALLVPPILAEQMKRLAQTPGGLEGVKNREAVYARTLPALLDKGLVSLRSKGYAPAIANHWTQATLEGVFNRLAWKMAEVDEAAEADARRLTGTARGEELESLKAELSMELSVLWQLGVTIGAVLFDRDGQRETGLAWRHLSFCEYFAGQYLARLKPAEQRLVVVQHARDVRWRWILRFALSSAERRARDSRGSRRQRQQARASLVSLSRGLIAGGNPFLVAEAMRRDRVRLLGPLAHQVRWLVHRDDAYAQLGSRLPRDADDQPLPPRLTREFAEDLAGLFDPGRRDSRALSAAWDLVERGCGSGPRDVAAICERTREQFLGEFERMVEQAVKRFRRGKPAKPRDAVVRSLVPEERQVRLGWLRKEECAARRRWSPQLGGVLQQERASFCACPPEGWQHPTDPTRDPLEFDMGSPKDDDEQPRHRVRLPGPVWLGRGPVTNRQYELFDAGHAREAEWQSASDRLDEHPVVNVSHHQAALFCRWLTGTGANGRYRLPTEVEWEFGCRAGRDGEGEHYGVGDGRELTHADANFSFDKGRTTVVGTYAPNAWGLCDTHGNAWEWCADWYHQAWYQQRASAGGPPWPSDTGPPVGSFRVLRGGSWFFGVISCRAANRDLRAPEARVYNVGFRVSWGGE